MTLIILMFLYAKNLIDYWNWNKSFDESSLVT